MPNRHLSHKREFTFIHSFQGFKGGLEDPQLFAHINSSILKSSDLTVSPLKLRQVRKQEAGVFPIRATNKLFHPPSKRTRKAT